MVNSWVSGGAERRSVLALFEISSVASIIFLQYSIYPYESFQTLQIFYLKIFRIYPYANILLLRLMSTARRISYATNSKIRGLTNYTIIISLIYYKLEDITTGLVNTIIISRIKVLKVCTKLYLPTLCTIENPKNSTF